MSQTSTLNLFLSPASGLPCAFLLLVLKEQLQELQAALLASILDMKEYRKGCSSSSTSCSGLNSPLEWTDGLLLLHSCPPPMDEHLLGLLGCSSVRPRIPPVLSSFLSLLLSLPSPASLSLILPHQSVSFRRNRIG